ncbi:nickel-responsive transcriptional regulator NikR [Novosphingobium sp.]|uniref:nickel-responsive transcriptional regulator NikR n=1 Tax=Novosphingobium sp. TaxID=1874826 RepID=UPI003B52C16E
MQRITISLDDPLAAALDAFLQKTGYHSRSEGVRDLVREAMGRTANEQAVHAISVANLSYIYNRRVRLLASRLSDMQHAHHNLIASTTLVHLDHDFSLESVMLKGPTQSVRDFADKVRAERGVLSAMLNLVGVEAGDLHEHDHDHSHTGQKHLSPTVS